ncbi:MAG: hypothetical protein LAO55_16210 [Acidobacteriia bacterium]|nr:hypothetical protein [Terriglobia bacterium]
MSSSKLRVGDWVEVRGKEEILRTLDKNGQHDGMPFMPEMFAFCGKKFQVYKRAHKTCDTVFPVRGRRVHRAVHLETRCSGEAHDGCQAGCLIFWKEAWLNPAPGASGGTAELAGPLAQDTRPVAAPRCTEEDVIAQASSAGANGTLSYRCQATQLPYATANLSWWEFSQYFEDYWSGNVSLWRILCGGIYSVYYSLTKAGIKLGRPLRWFYDTFYPLWRGTPFPRKHGIIPDGQPTPAQTLNLQAGELVRVKSHDEILKTLNPANRNRGMFWDAEEVPYCGGTYRVLRRVDKIINEKTGKMLHMKTPCVILDGVICQSRFSDHRMFCPRSIYSYWREIWLERVG